MPDANPINPTYTFQNAYHSQVQQGTFSRTVRVTATQNNPLTLTGSFANNAAFVVMNTGSIAISASNGQGYNASVFHPANQNHTIYPIQLSYVSASAAGDVTVLYY
jgi:hypothetical protein